MKCTVVTVSSNGYSWKECKECCMFICSICGRHCHSILHDSKWTAICPECEEEKKGE